LSRDRAHPTVGQAGVACAKSIFTLAPAPSATASAQQSHTALLLPMVLLGVKFDDGARSSNLKHKPLPPAF